MNQNPNLKIKISPLTIVQIIQAYTYNRGTEGNRICGSLFGSSQIDTIEVTNSYFIPEFVFDVEEEDNEQSEQVGFIETIQKEAIDYHQKYVKTNKEVFPNETFVGLFLTVSENLQQDIAKVLQCFRNRKQSLFNPVQSLQSPFILILDPSMSSGNLGLRAYCVVEDFK